MHKSGFTLIELSIVLVIIGLIVGGILTGRDLIDAAAQRAQLTQIERYNTAVRTFQNKYGYLPGDIPTPYASNFGFVARGTVPGQGDGDGVLTYGSGGWICGCYEGAGETSVFWVDLSTAGLIDGAFNTATEASMVSTNPSLLFPNAKIGQGNYVYAWSGGPNGAASSSSINGNGINYFGIVAVNSVALSTSSLMVSTPGVTVLQAYNIDRKTDDGLPQSGNVTTLYATYNSGWNSATEQWAGGNYQVSPYTAATAGSATSCFDNSATASGTPGVAGAAQHYSFEINTGTAQNCALSFRFQ